LYFQFLGCFPTGALHSRKSHHAGLGSIVVIHVYIFTHVALSKQPACLLPSITMLEVEAPTVGAALSGGGGARVSHEPRMSLA
jgi:hypothetical protein